MANWRVFSCESLGLSVLEGQPASKGDGYDLSEFVSCTAVCLDSCHMDERTRGHGWQFVWEELDELSRLEDNWDSQGAIAPTKDVINGAFNLARDLAVLDYPPPHRVVASVNGTIYLEWDTPMIFQEIEVTSACEAECRRVDRCTEKTSTWLLKWC